MRQINRGSLMNRRRFQFEMIALMLLIAHCISAISIVRQSDPFYFPTGIRNEIGGSRSYQMLSYSAPGQSRNGMRITWSLPCLPAANTSISLYTASGRQIDRIAVNGPNGFATVRLNLAKGVYFIRLSGPGLTAVRQAIVH